MPMKLTAGVSKKVGLPGYSSAGAICHVELELDHGLISADPDAFRAQVRQVYAQCAASVEEELARQQAPQCAGSNTARTIDASAADGPVPATCSPDGHANGYGLPAGSNPSQPRTRPSLRQMQYAQDLADRRPRCASWSGSQTGFSRSRWGSSRAARPAG